MFNLKLQRHNTRSFCYASAMRTLGLLLEMRDLKTFDLKCDNSGFRLHAGYQTPPCVTPVELRYSNEELESLGRENLCNSNDSRKIVDILSLAEMLRGLGSYVDAKQARLLRISNNDANIPAGSVKLEYTCAEGDSREETIPLSSIYDICVHLFKKQGKTKTPASHFAGKSQ